MPCKLSDDALGKAEADAPSAWASATYTEDSNLAPGSVYVLTWVVWVSLKWVHLKTVIHTHCLFNKNNYIEPLLL